LRFGARSLLREPTFTLAAIVVLALGMGASTAIFTLVHSLLMEPLSYPESERLVWIWTILPRGGGMDALLPDDSIEFRSRNRSFEKVAGLSRTLWSLSGIGGAQLFSGAYVTEDFFVTLGVAPKLGRAFRAEEYRAGQERKVIFSHSVWLGRFGGDPGLIGRSVFVDGFPYEVVGVMPPDFPLAADFEMWAPLAENSPNATGNQFRMRRTFGRLRKGARLAAAQAEATAMAMDFAHRNPVDRECLYKLITFSDQVVGGVRQTLWIFAAAVGCVLLIACSNVASLLLARGVARSREMAVRAAVGASRSHLVRQLLVESALLAVAGGALGYPLAVAGVRLLVALDPHTLPRAQEIHTGVSVLAFAFALSLLTGLVFGIVPALRGSRIALHAALKESGRSTTAGRQGNLFRAGLVVIEVGLGVVLMTAAGLLVRSFQALNEVRPGYDSRNILTMQIALPAARYRDKALDARFFEQLIHRVEQLPGVEAAGTTNFLPLGTDVNTVGIWLDSAPVKSEETKIRLDNRVVTPGFFRAMGVPLIAGRDFAWTDRAETPNVLIVNQTFARQFFPNGDALGKRIVMDLGFPFTTEIVGVVGSFREATLAEEPRREIFTVHAQTTIRGQTLTVRSAGAPAPLAHVIQGIIENLDKDVPIYKLRTMQEQVDQSVVQPRMRRTLMSLFSAVALLLASFGVYGVIACGVAERRHEIGIRMALGAQAVGVRWMVVRQGLKLTALGLGLGLAGAAIATRLIRSFLFGVSAGDPLTFVVTASAFIVATLAASYLPARRATRVDPLTVLREE
jgi:putative ABC transport system permease protein